MEDAMKPFEQKILQLWDMQDLYAMTVDPDERTRATAGGQSSELPAERMRKLIPDLKSSTVDVLASNSATSLRGPSPRRETA
jgi:hypothetical protein